MSAREAMPHGPALEVFRSLDADNSGRLERGELQQALRRMRLHGILIEDIDALLAILDPSGDGTVTFEEFVAALDAGLDVHVLLLPVAAPGGGEEEEALLDYAAAKDRTLTPLNLADKLAHAMGNLSYGQGRHDGDALGLLRFCGEMEVLPTASRVVRGESLETRSALAIQKRVRGMQTRSKVRRAVRALMSRVVHGRIDWAVYGWIGWVDNVGCGSLW